MVYVQHTSLILFWETSAAEDVVVVVAVVDHV